MMAWALLVMTVMQVLAPERLTVRCGYASHPRLTSSTRVMNLMIGRISARLTHWKLSRVPSYV